MSFDARAQALSALSQFLVARSSMGETLLRVSTITTDALPSATMAGITMLGEDGKPTTSVFTDEQSPEIDEAQYSSGPGPCLDSLRHAKVVRLDDMETAARSTRSSPRRHRPTASRAPCPCRSWSATRASAPSTSTPRRPMASRPTTSSSAWSSPGRRRSSSQRQRVLGGGPVERSARSGDAEPGGDKAGQGHADGPLPRDERRGRLRSPPQGLATGEREALRHCPAARDRRNGDSGSGEAPLII